MQSAQLLVSILLVDTTTLICGEKLTWLHKIWSWTCLVNITWHYHTKFQSICILGVVFLNFTANRDPVANIIGDRYAVAGSDVGMLRLHDEIASLRGNSESSEVAHVAMKKVTLKLLKQLTSLDSRVMGECIKVISASVFCDWIYCYCI